LRTYRLFAPAALLLLAGCDNAPDNGRLAEAEAAAAREAADAGRIDCALAGETRFDRVCAVERMVAEGRNLLVLRHPDGGFRRFEMVGDGRGLVAADGFDDSRVRIVGDGMIELAVGEDRYRLPATVRPGATAAASE
jgi:hypothetical protein